MKSIYPLLFLLTVTNHISAATLNSANNSRTQTESELIFNLPPAPDFKIVNVDTKGKPYLCEGNAIITTREGVTNLTTLKYFGTSISIDIYDAGSNNSKQALCNALNVIQEYHYLASNYSTYPHVTNIKSINNAPEKQHKIDPKLTELIKQSIDWHDKSDGYFNIALSPVIQIWRDYRAQCIGERKNQDRCEIPTQAELEAARPLINIENIKLNSEQNTIQMLAGMSIDLGGIAKGWMAEKVYFKLKEDGVQNFMINAGGNIRHYGVHPQGRTFVTAVEDPICKKYQNSLSRCQSFEGQYHEVMTGRDITVVSSGNYLKYYRVKGEEFHHIINPKTLYPKRSGISTTIVMNNNQIYADIISTALFLMPLDKALAYANNNNNVEAVWFLNEQGEKIESDEFNIYRKQL
ncbi:FAD:protein FMN transferase [Shewanella schlegeliana]|uniref:FAD:protein FMN transferase n=1 Tax=Shewanella schlegeliana TaxID=190308 RepID=A0ABS1SZK5_9GAMM|nr:FAD:protein FMN transferase [Shewanella schlegeliana]MBL4913963.1 FAD:protein FMN transferase [Shewanella schlegeliana]MCL1108653.1 FAD:protein FMN transferase [Shewanella schlegeliana]GIU35453.1 FAD:protein FMN transferase [Shewanella schlegeliana]